MLQKRRSSSSLGDAGRPAKLLRRGSSGETLDCAERVWSRLDGVVDGWLAPDRKRLKGPRFVGSPARVRVEKTRSRRIDAGSSPAAGGTLGHRRLDG